jgi:3-phenylpropionate/cinnamic acid dioxygenase small subunit
MTASDESRLAALLARVEVLEQQQSILDLLYRYGHAIDYGLEKEWVDCFTPEGAFDMRHRLTAGSGTSPNGQWDTIDQRLEGHDALLGFVAGHTRAPDRYHKHVVVEPRITLEDSEARVESYFMFVHEHDGRAEVGAFGRYKDVVTRGADSRWRFVERIAEIEVS